MGPASRVSCDVAMPSSAAERNSVRKMQPASCIGGVMVLLASICPSVSTARVRSGCGAAGGWRFYLVQPGTGR
ncbi:hypothetical protein GCM10011504_55840 [Siccirubricoccus deserti]|nr:hypothetical protein GCM10011504_55840 [Siccirubricoccus deserti]